MKVLLHLAHIFAMAALPWWGLIACSTPDHPESLPLEPISVTEIKTVAGAWEGIMTRSPAARSEDWVQVEIREDGGYHFKAFRTIGVFSGSGRFVLEEGMLVAQSEKGTIRAQLFRRASKDDPVLEAEGRASDGLTYRARLTRKRPSPRSE